MPQQRRLSRLLALPFLAALMFTTGCTTVGYYAQAVGGHLSLMSKRQPLEKVLASDATDEEIKRKLQLLKDARVFAVAELGLPNNKSYSTFVKTDKRYVTWNVVATPEFSISPKTWCFPVAGCVSYRGYFDEADARAYAKGLDTDGFDTHVGGASAYSTLGWFDDPLLDTMLRGSDIRLTGILFHELAHQLLYIQDDSSFNEAFASFVEQQGVREWLRSEGKEETLPLYEKYLQRQVDFNNLLQQTRRDLISLYMSLEPVKDLDAEAREEIRLRKKAVFDTMLERYEVLKAERWGGFEGYDNWFAREINNARLISVSTYLKWIPAFKSLFEESGSSFDDFYVQARELSKKPYAERQVELERLLAPDAEAADGLATN